MTILLDADFRTKPAVPIWISDFPPLYLSSYCILAFFMLRSSNMQLDERTSAHVGPHICVRSSSCPSQGSAPDECHVNDYFVMLLSEKALTKITANACGFGNPT